MDSQTELKGLQIDRSARREREPKPVLRLFVIATFVALAAIGAVIAYRALNAATPVEVQTSAIADERFLGRRAGDPDGYRLHYRGP